MKLIAGLGNPGRRYAGTRHNIGFDVVDVLVGRHRLEWEAAPRGIEALTARWRGGRNGASDAALAQWRPRGGVQGAPPFNEDTVLAKPLMFMNLSGHAVLALLQFFKIDVPDLLVVVDDVNLELGRLRARGSGSAGGHNGLKSLIETLGTEDFSRLRIGVGRGDGRGDLADHVTAKFDPDERTNVAEAASRAADAVELFIADGIAPVMNRFNRKEDGE
jgi:peptidyl-tRNA hydrolase, PTH1 family